MTNDRSECTARHHDTRSAYDHHGCRCPGAREQARLYHKRSREGRQPAGHVDPDIAVRKLQALQALGHSRAEIARQMGYSGVDIIENIQRATRLQRHTHDAVGRVYDELSMTPGSSNVTRGRARAAGYRPPLAWDDIDHDPEPAAEHIAGRDDVDHSAIERAVTGDVPEVLHDEDRRRVVDRLADEGRSRSEIAQDLNITVGQVDRDREAMSRRRAREREAELDLSL